MRKGVRGINRVGVGVEKGAALEGNVGRIASERVEGDVRLDSSGVGDFDDSAAVVRGVGRGAEVILQHGQSDQLPFESCYQRENQESPDHSLFSKLPG